MKTQYKLVYTDTMRDVGFKDHPLGLHFKSRSKFAEKLRIVYEDPERYKIIRVEVKEMWDIGDIEEMHRAQHHNRVMERFLASKEA